MKKFVSVLIAAMLALVSLVSCGGSGKWIEVASISYDIGSGVKTFISTYKIFKEVEEITQNEFDNAPIEKKQIPQGVNYYDFYDDKVWGFADGNVTENRQELINTLKLIDGKTFYEQIKSDFDEINFYRTEKILRYDIRYVTIRFINDETIEIKYFDKEVNGEDIYITDKVKPTTYKITYFND